MLSDYFFLSFNNLRRRRLRSWLTIIGILIGITSVVALIELGDGLKAAVNSQFGISSTEVVTIQAGGLNGFGPPGSGVVNHLTTDDVNAIERISQVEFAIPRNIPTVKFEFNDIENIGFAGSVPYKDKKDFFYEQLEIEVEAGRLLKDSDVKKVFLGWNFGQSDNGYEKAIVNGDTVIINGEKFEVVGIAKKKGSFILDSILMINDDTLDDLVGYGKDADIIVAKVKSKEQIQLAKENIERLLRKRRGVKIGQEDFEVSTPDAALSTVNDVLTGVQVFFVIVAVISVFVGAIGIVNTMTTSVLERKKQIGIMKAIGARNGDIFWLFFIESGLMGLVGGIIGVICGSLIGYVGTAGISAFIGSNVAPRFDFILIFGSLFGSFLIGSISGIVPALRAAKLNPVDALRG